MRKRAGKKLKLNKAVYGGETGWLGPNIDPRKLFYSVSKRALVLHLSPLHFTASSDYYFNMRRYLNYRKSNIVIYTDGRTKTYVMSAAFNPNIS